MILTDWEIAELCDIDRPMISPFSKAIKEEGVLSYGLSGTGYDIRLGNKFTLIEKRHPYIYSPKSPHRNFHTEFTSEYPFFLEPYGCLLAVSYEKFIMPKTIVGICVGKSTYARSFVNVLVTPLEAGWEGYLTIEIVNLQSNPVEIYPMEGIAQIIFHRTKTPDNDYGKRLGKYQGQESKPVLSMVK